MDRSEVRKAVRDERHRLAATLRTLRSEQWEGPSLCAGWRIRDVVGHLVALNAYYRTAARPVLGFARVGFRPNVFVAKDARRRAQSLPVDTLPNALEGAAFEEGIVARIHPWSVVALSEIVVHGQDIRRALRIHHGIPVARLQAVGAFLWRVGHVMLDRKKVRDLRFEATDVEWIVGEGLAVRGPLEAFVVALAGRPAALAELHGEGLDRLRRRLDPATRGG